MLYNILLPISCYIGNNTTKHHSKGMSDNRDLTEVFYQKVSSLLIHLPVKIFPVMFQVSSDTCAVIIHEWHAG